MRQQILSILLLFSFSRVHPSTIHFLNNSGQIICVSNHQNFIIMLQPNETYTFSSSELMNLFFYAQDNLETHQVFTFKFQLSEIKIDDQEITISWQDLQIPKKLEILFPDRFLIIKHKPFNAQKQTAPSKPVSPHQTHQAHQTAVPAPTNHSDAPKNEHAQKNHSKNRQDFINNDACMAVVNTLAKQVEAMRKDKGINIDWKSLHAAKRSSRRR